MPSAEANYGGSRQLPVHAVVEDPLADLDSGLLIRVHVALLGLSEGQIVKVESPVVAVTDQLRSFDVRAAMRSCRWSLTRSEPAGPRTTCARVELGPIG